jgi:light-regulated signal transduction histidine kinase (bacteriophytochrome)
MKKTGVKSSRRRKMIHHEARHLDAALSQRIEERTNELRAAHVEMENFTNAVSHDLRAPLIHIGGFVDLLFEHLEQRLDERGRHYLDTITSSAYQMGRMIDEVLEYSRLNRVELLKVPLDLELMVKEVVDDLRQLTEKRRVIWMIGHLPTVEADPTLLRQVIVNLTINALKFTAPREEARIHVAARRGEGETIVSVRDNGVGFDMKYRKKLFGMFQRLHTAAEFDGNGVGLAHVARIIQRHGGRTWAEGVLGGGATVYFSLPDGKAGHS